ncbi:MAG: outer membrane beta-barrel protein [Turneriella sp.]|nr:outer membrane beta-barrel protein [Turneriella sp.]
MKKLFLGLAFVASTSVFASVKDGKIGVDFSFAGSTGVTAGTTTVPTIGAWWHVIDMVAIRAGVGYQSVNTTNSSTTSDKTDSGFVFSIGVPIYLAKMNALDLYVSPAFSYASLSTKTTTTTPATSTSGTSSGLGISLSLGLQVALNDQLHFFGEAGFGYSTYTNDPSKTTTIGTARGAVGAIFYFN